MSNKYILFATADYYPSGGWKDFQCLGDTPQQAIDSWLTMPGWSDWEDKIHIVSTGEWRITLEGELMWEYFKRFPKADPSKVKDPLRYVVHGVDGAVLGWYADLHAAIGVADIERDLLTVVDTLPPCKARDEGNVLVLRRVMPPTREPEDA